MAAGGFGVERQVDAEQFCPHAETVPMGVPEVRLATCHSQGFEQAVAVHERAIEHRNGGCLGRLKLAVDRNELHFAALTTSTSLITTFCLVLFVMLWVAAA